MFYDMLQHTWTQSPLRRETTPADDRINVEAARMNPWLRWRPKHLKPAPVLSVAELAECTCPDLCDRDHANE